MAEQQIPAESGGIGEWISDHKTVVIIGGVVLLGLAYALYKRSQNNSSTSSSSTSGGNTTTPYGGQYQLPYQGMSGYDVTSAIEAALASQMAAATGSTTSSQQAASGSTTSNVGSTTTTPSSGAGLSQFPSWSPNGQPLYDTFGSNPPHKGPISIQPAQSPSYPLSGFEVGNNGQPYVTQAQFNWQTSQPLSSANIAAAGKGGPNDLTSLAALNNGQGPNPAELAYFDSLNVHARPLLNS